jgi:hypothetical protein
LLLVAFSSRLLFLSAFQTAGKLLGLKNWVRSTSAKVWASKQMENNSLHYPEFAAKVN